MNSIINGRLLAFFQKQCECQECQKIEVTLQGVWLKVGENTTAALKWQRRLAAEP
jgi:hypothetical protein